MGLDELLGLLPFLFHNVDESSPGQYLLLLELGFWAVVILLTWVLLRVRPRVLATCESIVRQTSKHQRFWLVGFGFAVILFRVALLPKIPVPIPAVHDEFSYLVGADTFAHGRLTNPSTPMWQHFESFHINMQPTYQSMYPPAQGMALALGQKLTGTPWAGVVLTTALLCSAIYWMLLGWLPPQWAWIGGAFSVIRFGLVSYWINSYMGGSAAALGGALALGALPRLRREIKPSAAVAFVLGLLILANSRPLEGFLFSVPLGIVALWSIFTSTTPARHKLTALWPAFALLLLGLAWIPYYNWRGTGNPLLMPYALNFKEYHITTPYLFQKSNPIPEYRHEAMRTLYVFHEYPDVVRPRFEGIGYILDRTACRHYVFYLWPFLLLVAPAMLGILRDKSLRVVLISLGLLAASMFAQRWQPEAHYAAPATAAMLLLVMYALRRFRTSHGIYTVAASRAIVIAFGLLMISSIANRIRDPFYLSPAANNREVAQAAQRAGIRSAILRERIKADLDQLPGKQLLIVHHPYRDVPTTDWIYNDADLDTAHILWARDMGYLKNRELVNYYPDRQVWYVDKGDPVARLVPYNEAMTHWRMALEKFEIGTEPEPRNALRTPDFKETGEGTPKLLPVSNSATHRFPEKSTLNR